jgi:hypothetical protein
MSDKQEHIGETTDALNSDSAKSITEHSGIKSCLHCGSEMPARASFCVTCKCYQSSWRNSVTIIGGMTGLMTFMLSAISFTWVNSIDIVEKMNWKQRVEVRYFRTQLFPEFDAVFSNSGIEPAYIDEMTVYYRRGYVRFRVNRQIPPKQFLAVENIDKSANNTYSTFIAKDFVTNESGQINMNVLHNQDFAFKDAKNIENKCFTPVFFLADEGDIKRISGTAAPGKRLVSEPAEGHLLYYRSATGEKVEATFPVVVAFVRSTSTSCLSLDVE